MTARSYGGLVLEHFRHPRNHGKLADPDVSEEGVNALCGDIIRVDLAFRGERIEDVRFTANACAICVASASLLTERLMGMTTAAAAALREESAVAQLSTEIPEGRVSCAVLPLRTAQRAVARWRAMHVA